jgi:hypothetical protein
MTDKRRQPRLRTLKAGKIIFNHRSSVIDCTIRNLSVGGSCLQVSSTMAVPTTFDLVIDAEKENRVCRVMWKTENRIGVSFQRRCAPTP